MKANLSSNKELDNYKGQDAFNFIIKANAIKSFLEFSLDSLKDNKMIVLYGDWGSGKSSLMKHIDKNINKTIYFPIFFKAWEHEKDDNLAFSLCDAITNSLDKSNEVIKDFMKAALTTLKCFASGITIKTPATLSGLGVDIEFSGEKYIKAIDESLKDNEPISFYKSLADFKDKFKIVEEHILKQTEATKVLIFIDDLDRCEPENVLNLITAIKLFFTYGEHTVYFCGLDKNAVNTAVRTKYKDVVKSEEYLEKVFDISFNMPKTYDIKGILLPHFKNFNRNLKYKDWSGIDQTKILNSISLIEEFFRAINFTNPRHLKKVLNKYEILNSYSWAGNLSEEFISLIPDIISRNNESKIFETIFCLFIIILYEYNLEEFKEIENYEFKIVNYLKKYEEINNTHDRESKKNKFYIKDYHNTTFNEIQLLDTEYGYSKFIYIFSRSNPTMMYNLVNHEIDKFNLFFTDNNMSTNFCKFLIKHIEEIAAESISSKYLIFNLFNMAKYLL